MEFVYNFCSNRESNFWWWLRNVTNDSRKLKGILGGIFATLGMVFPSIVIITIIAIFFEQFQNLQIVQHAFGGIRVVVVALIINMWKKSIKDYIGIIIFSVAFIVVAFLKLSPVVVVITSFAVGLIIQQNKDDDRK